MSNQEREVLFEIQLLKVENLYTRKRLYSTSSKQFHETLAYYYYLERRVRSQILGAISNKLVNISR